MIKDSGFRTYASANRVSQELLWESVSTSIERQLPTLNARAKELSNASSAELQIDPEFETPKYVTALDIHCMPGGYAGEVCMDC